MAPPRPLSAGSIDVRPTRSHVRPTPGRLLRDHPPNFGTCCHRRMRRTTGNDDRPGTENISEDTRPQDARTRAHKEPQLPPPPSSPRHQQPPVAGQRQQGSHHMRRPPAPNPRPCVCWGGGGGGDRHGGPRDATQREVKSRASDEATSPRRRPASWPSPPAALSSPFCRPGPERGTGDLGSPELAPCNLHRLSLNAKRSSSHSKTIACSRCASWWRIAGPALNAYTAANLSLRSLLEASRALLWNSGPTRTNLESTNTSTLRTRPNSLESLATCLVRVSWGKRCLCEASFNRWFPHEAGSL